MADEALDSAEIKETDIIFDCPHCGKSLAIDYRGAGLTIPCSDCGRTVEVPIPEGMEITDIDRTEEDREMQVLNLRRLLAESERRMERIQSELDDVSSRRAELEKERTAYTDRATRIEGKLAVLTSSLRTAVDALEEIGEALNG